MRLRPLLRTALLAWIGWRLLGREVPPPASGPQERPPGPPGRSVVVGRHEFFVRESGPPDGEPLVLLHGWLYDGHATWHRVQPRLAESRRVYSIDLRNHGRSDRVRGRFDISDVADEVARVLDSLGLGSVPVVGYSMGGMAAQELALRHPARVSALILGATAARPVALPRAVTVPVFVAGRALARVDRTLLPRLAHRYLMATKVFPREHSEWLWQALLDRDTDLYYEGGFAILRFDASADVPRITMPTLSIIPTADQLIAPRLQHETASLIGAEVVEIVGGRHEAVLTHGDEVAKAIVEFLG